MKTLLFCGHNGQEEIHAIRQAAADFGLDYQHYPLKGSWFKNADLIDNAELVVVWNGWHDQGPVIIESCRRKNVPYVVMEYGFLPQSETYMLDRRGFLGHSALMDDISWVTDEDMRRLYDTRAELQAQHPLKPQGHVLVPLQLHNDTQVLFHVKHRTMTEFMEELALLYPTQPVIVRPHPKSGGTLTPQAPNQTIDKTGTWLEAASKASAVVGLTSTCLIESAILGVPTISLANCPLNHYRHRDHARLLAAYLARRAYRHCPLADTIERIIQP